MRPTCFPRLHRQLRPPDKLVKASEGVPSGRRSHDRMIPVETSYRRTRIRLRPDRVDEPDLARHAANKRIETHHRQGTGGTLFVYAKAD